MGGLVPAIHALKRGVAAKGSKDVDARHKAGHGELYFLRRVSRVRDDEKPHTSSHSRRTAASAFSAAGVPSNTMVPWPIT